MWKKNAARWADGGAWPGGRAAWADRQAVIRADAERDRARWSGKAEDANSTARAAAGDMRRCEDAAANAADAAGLPGAAPPGAQGAAAAWEEAMESARRAAAACRPGK